MNATMTILRKVTTVVLSTLLALKISPGVAHSVNVDQIIHHSIEKFKKVYDYTCKLDKKVKKNGTIHTDLGIFVKYKKPKHYYFRWEQGGFKGQEVIFVSGRNNGKIVAHPGGVFQFVTLRLDPDGHMAMKRNHHSLRESGMEKIMSIIENDYYRSEKTGLGMIRLAGEDRIDGNDVWVIHGVFPEDRGFYAHSIVVYFDQTLRLPIKITVYDGSNTLIEEYVFRNLRINVGFREWDFDPGNPEYGFFNARFWRKPLAP